MLLAIDLSGSMRTDDMQAKLRSLSFSTPIQTPEEMARELSQDSDLNRDIIKAANVKIE